MNKWLTGAWYSAFYDERAFKNPKGEGSRVNATLPNHHAKWLGICMNEHYLTPFQKGLIILACLLFQALITLVKENNSFLF